MLALFWIIAGSLALMLVAPPLLFIYLSLAPHLGPRPLLATENSLPELDDSQRQPIVPRPKHIERATLRPAA